MTGAWRLWSLLLILCLVFFILLAQFQQLSTDLDIVQSSLRQCNEKRDSLSAQILVVFDHKTGMERILNRTIADHQTELSALQDNLHTLKRQLHTQNEALSKCRLSLTPQSNDMEMSSLKRRLMELQDKLNKTETELAETQAANRRLDGIDRSRSLLARSANGPLTMKNANPVEMMKTSTQHYVLNESVRFERPIGGRPQLVFHRDEPLDEERKAPVLLKEIAKHLKPDQGAEVVEEEDEKPLPDEDYKDTAHRR